MAWLPRVGGARRSTPIQLLLVLLGCVLILHFLINSHQTCDPVPEVSDRGVNVRELQSTREVPQPVMFSRNESCQCGYNWRPQREPSLVFPSPDRGKVFLTMGIPTVRRQGENYIIATLRSLLDNLAADDRKDVLIVVMLADLDAKPREEMGTEIYSHFASEIKTGLINVIQAPASFYPVLHITKHTYGQTDTYIRWRAKQNFDSSFLFKYSISMSTYYMALEDDITTLPEYIKAIRSYIALQKDPWTCLEFSELGFIGKLYRNEDLLTLAILFELFHLEQPLDYTYLYFNMLTLQMQQRLRKPTLFQHQGLKSSYPGKIQPLKDRFFDKMAKTHKGDNPEAEVISTMEAYNTFVPKLAYSKAEGYFWSHGNPREGDTFTVIFNEPQSLLRVVVETGSFTHPNDSLVDARLDASLTLLKSQNKMECTNDIPLGEFRDRRVDVTGLKEKIKFKVMCIRVTVTKLHKAWAIIREVAVFVNKNATTTK